MSKLFKMKTRKLSELSKTINRKSLLASHWCKTLTFLTQDMSIVILEKHEPTIALAMQHRDPILMFWLLTLVHWISFHLQLHWSWTSRGRNNFDGCFWLRQSQQHLQLWNFFCFWHLQTQNRESKWLDIIWTPWDHSETYPRMIWSTELCPLCQKMYMKLISHLQTCQNIFSLSYRVIKARTCPFLLCTCFQTSVFTMA